MLGIMLLTYSFSYNLNRFNQAVTFLQPVAENQPASYTKKNSNYSIHTGFIYI